MPLGPSDSSAGRNDQAESFRLIAVIDIGATSVRMMIAEVDAEGNVRTLESLAQAVQLGRDSFLKGRISRSTIEDCVHVLKVYRDKLTEYGIDHPKDIRVVATSAVREADNRLAFNDRIYIATGFHIEPFDEAQLHRTTYLGIFPILDQFPEMLDGQTVVCEVGGGTTELLVLEQGQLVFAKTYRLGALRMIKAMEAFHAATVRSRELLESQIEKAANQIESSIRDFEKRQLVVMGGDVRLAASELVETASSELVTRLPIKKLKDFAESIVQMSPEAIMQRFQLSVNEAESLGPALLANLVIAERLQVDTLHVAQVNLRDGLIKEMTSDFEFRQAESQVIQSAISLGRKFDFDEVHAMHVERLATDLFQQTQGLHMLGPRWLLLLRIAAIVHEVGKTINERGYHKHSQYIVRSSVLFGINSHDVNLVSLIARYHRRALPQPRHEFYSLLNLDDRASVSKLAAILRIAKSLDASRSQRVHDIQCKVKGGTLRIFVPGITDVSLEQLDLLRQRDLFEYIFGLKADLTLVPFDQSNT